MLPLTIKLCTHFYLCVFVTNDNLNLKNFPFRLNFNFIAICLILNLLD